MPKRRTTSTHALREEAVSRFHDLLAADDTLSPLLFEKLRSAMRKKRLLYGDRPIGIALRPHLLDQTQFRALTLVAERVTSALEKVASAVVQGPKLMGELGLTEADCKIALVGLREEIGHTAAMSSDVEDELRHLISVVPGVTFDRILRSQRGRGHERLSYNDQHTQSLPKVRRGNPGRRARRRLPRLPSEKWPYSTRRRGGKRI